MKIIETEWSMSKPTYRKCWRPGGPGPKPTLFDVFGEEIVMEALRLSKGADPKIDLGEYINILMLAKKLNLVVQRNDTDDEDE